MIARITGRRLQARRLRVWSRDPHCVDCGELCSYPSGFELDHDVALVNGGTDTEDNCRVRCIPCHERKTRRDLGQRERVEIGADGWPVERAMRGIIRHRG